MAKAKSMSSALEKPINQLLQDLINSLGAQIGLVNTSASPTTKKTSQKQTTKSTPTPKQQQAQPSFNTLVNQISQGVGSAVSSGIGSFVGTSSALTKPSTPAQAPGTLGSNLQTFQNVYNFGNQTASRGLGTAIAGPLGGKLLGDTLANNPFTKTVNQFFELAKQVDDSVQALRKWTDGLLKSHLQFSEFSAAMSLVQARQEVRDIRLSKERGDRRAASAEALAQQRQEFEQRWARIEDNTAIIASYLASGFLRTTNTVGRGFDNVLTALGLLVPKAKEEENTLNDWMLDIAREQVDEVYGRPERF